MSPADRPAIVLLSGGLDSATVLYLAIAAGFRPIAVSFRYGQRHAVELDAASAIARRAGVADHRVIDLDPSVFHGSSLTGGGPVPKDRPELDIGSAVADPLERHVGEIPSTYVPARNAVFLSFAIAIAETARAGDIYIGVNAVDFSGYPDCRPDFISAFERMANLATRLGSEGDGIRIHAPLMKWSKAEIVRRGLLLGVDYSLTRSCYDPNPAGAGCGHCDSCRLRLAAFRELGSADPAPYR